MHTPCGTQSGSGSMNADKSQHSKPAKQLLGASVQPWTWQECVWNESQNVASVPAQSSGVVQGLPSPTGGLWQIPAALHA